LSIFCRKVRLQLTSKHVETQTKTVR